MGLFKDVKKPTIRPAARAGADISPLRPRFVAKQPPCSAGCPAGVDVRGWLTLVAQAAASGRNADEAFDMAWRIVADANPFPATLGRICPHPCEQGCHRSIKDGAVRVNALEGALGDRALDLGCRLPLLPTSNRLARVAIVGAGAAGLSCAYQMARRGHQAVVFEATDVAGGRLRDATRTGRLPSAVVDGEIARVLGLGIELRCSRAVVDDPARLAADYDFVFVATGRRPVGTPVSDHPHALTGGDVSRPGLVGAAIAAGRRAADIFDDAINGRAPGRHPELPAISVERVKLSWYPEASRADAPTLDFVEEAKRCLSCGLCMDCERCWMFCTLNCFEKLPKGQHYRLDASACNGCRKCADECPCGCIDMR